MRFFVAEVEPVVTMTAEGGLQPNPMAVLSRLDYKVSF